MTRIIPIAGQSFASLTDWIANATARLTAHPSYRNTEHATRKGWNGEHFTALCYDQQGRRCRDGSDFQRAQAEDAYPVWFIWPDQVAKLVIERAVFDNMANTLAEQLHLLANNLGPVLEPLLDTVKDQQDPSVISLRDLLARLSALK